VNKLDRKILLVAALFLIVAMLATPLAVAKPTSAANNAKSVSFMWHSENGGHVEGMDVVKTNPPGAAPEDVIVTHTYGVWQLNDDFSNYVQIGDNDKITIYADHYEGDLYVQTVATSPTSGALNYRVYEKVMWGDGNYIEIMCLERASYEVVGFDPETGPIIDFYASGTFSGHGMIDGVKVQVTGVREGSFQEVGFVLECYGTIRYAGNL